MRVPLVDLRPQNKTLEAQISAAMRRVVESNQFILGETVESFERQIADYLGVAHAIGVSSGSDALLASLMALGVGAGDRVITTPFTFFATAGSIARLGAIPSFVDIDPHTFNLDPSALGNWFDRHPELAAEVKVILPVHLFGQSVEMDALLAIANERRIPVVEDVAQACGADYPSESGSRKTGSIGTLGTFSFFPTKNLGAMGDAGLITTNDREIAERVRQIRNHGSLERYHHAMLGGNFRLDAIQAAILETKLPHLDSWNAERRKLAAGYDASLKIEAITPPATPQGPAHHVYHQYVITLAERRDELKRHLHDHEIGCEIYYPRPLHEQKCFRDLGHRRGDLPHSEFAADRTLALPIYPGLTSEMQDFVIETIRKFFSA